MHVQVIKYYTYSERVMIPEKCHAMVAGDDPVTQERKAGVTQLAHVCICKTPTYVCMSCAHVIHMYIAKYRLQGQIQENRPYERTHCYTCVYLGYTEINRTREYNH